MLQNVETGLHSPGTQKAGAAPMRLPLTKYPGIQSFSFIQKRIAKMAANKSDDSR